MQKLEQTWRWYGPDDPVSLRDVKQAGATGIVTALHHVPHGEIWPKEEILKRKKSIEEAGLKWSVVESLPVHEIIKTGGSERDLYLENYRKSLKNLASCGLKTICYNFMPVLDWTRTDIRHELENGARALYFNWTDLALFDIFLLKRENAREDYTSEIISAAENKFKNSSQEDLDQLRHTILMGIPGEGAISLDSLRESIHTYATIGHGGLRENLIYFLEAIADTCEKNGIRMTMHPDDPPYPILGLPRIAGSLEDYQYFLQKVNKEFNGVCFCSGSLSSGENDIPELFEALKSRVHFVHLRNVAKDKAGSFYESDHLDGVVNMAELMDLLLTENQNREHPLPFRPDHGHEILDDIGKKTNPGYSAIGRLKGLAELRGIENALIYKSQHS